MNNIQPHYHYLTALTGAILFTVCYALVAKGRRNAKQAELYEGRFNVLQSIIQDWPVCEYNELMILKRLRELDKLPYKNSEKTNFLKDEFVRNYKVLKVDDPKPTVTQQIESENINRL